MCLLKGELLSLWKIAKIVYRSQDTVVRLPLRIMWLLDMAEGEYVGEQNGKIVAKIDAYGRISNQWFQNTVGTYYYYNVTVTIVLPRLPHDL